MGPYQIKEVFENETVLLEPIDGSTDTFLVNGHRIRLYKRPSTKEELLNDLCFDTGDTSSVTVLD